MPHLNHQDRREASNAIRISIYTLSQMRHVDPAALRALAAAGAALAPVLSGADACAVARGFAKARCHDAALFAALAQPAARAAERGDLNVQDVCGMLWACGEALQGNRELLGVLGKTAARLADGMDLARANAALWAFSTTRVQPPAELCEALADALPARVRGAAPRHLSMMAWSVVRCTSASASASGGAGAGGGGGAEQGEGEGVSVARLFELLPLIAEEARGEGTGTGSGSGSSGRLTAGNRGLTGDRRGGVARFSTEELCTLLWSLTHAKVDAVGLQLDAMRVLEQRIAGMAATETGPNHGGEGRGSRVPLRAAVMGEDAVQGGEATAWAW